MLLFSCKSHGKMIESHRNDFCCAIGLPIIVSKRFERVETTLVGFPDKADKQSLFDIALLIDAVRYG